VKLPADAREAMEGLGDELNNSMGAELNRISLSIKLSSIKMSCTGDPSGAGTAMHFVDSVAAQYQATACQVNQSTLDAFGRNCQQGQRPCSDSGAVPGSEHESRVTSAGLDPQRCYWYHSGSAKIVGCNIQPSGFRILHMENPAAVQ